MKKPTIEEIQAYVVEKNYNIDADAFLAYNEARGWRLRTGPMKDWKGSVRYCGAMGFSKTAKSTADFNKRNKPPENRERIRNLYEDHLRAKTPQALRDLRKDPGALGHAVWLIDEILAEAGVKT